jgi:hypothetical protein
MALRYLGPDGYQNNTDVVVVRSTHDCRYPVVALAMRCTMGYVDFPSHTRAGVVKTQRLVLGKCNQRWLRPIVVYSFLTCVNVLHHIHFPGHFVG